jgi:hypothetical protein
MFFDLNVAAEYPESADAGHRVVLEHTARPLRACYAALAREADAEQPEALANAFVLLMDGAYMAARLYGISPANPASTVGDAARVLIDAQHAR